MGRRTGLLRLKDPNLIRRSRTWGGPLTVTAFELVADTKHMSVGEMA